MTSIAVHFSVSANPDIDDQINVVNRPYVK